MHLDGDVSRDGQTAFPKPYVIADEFKIAVCPWYERQIIYRFHERKSFDFPVNVVEFHGISEAPIRSRKVELFPDDLFYFALYALELTFYDYRDLHVDRNICRIQDLDSRRYKTSGLNMSPDATDVLGGQAGILAGQVRLYCDFHRIRLFGIKGFYLMYAETRGLFDKLLIVGDKHRRGRALQIGDEAAAELFDCLVVRSSASRRGIREFDTGQLGE